MLPKEEFGNPNPSQYIGETGVPFACSEHAIWYKYCCVCTNKEPSGDWISRQQIEKWSAKEDSDETRWYSGSDQSC